MATSKRKRTSTIAKSNKRSKADPESDSEAHPESDLESDRDGDSEWWAVKDILDEGRFKNQLYYLLEWQDIDPKTGKVYTPEWQPADVVTEAALNDWEEERARKGRDRPRNLRSLKYEPWRYVVGQSGDQRQKKRNKSSVSRRDRSRKGRVIESSLEPSTVHSSAQQPVSPVPARDVTPIDLASTIVTSPGAGAAELPVLVSPRVQIRPRGSNLDRNEFDPFSQLPPLQSTSTQSHTQDTDLDSSQVDAATQPYSSNIVHDTQSSAGEAGFVPATQETNQQSTSTSTSDSQEDEGVTEDSGLLDISHEAASRESSPARSIPETVADTIFDSQSQPQGVDGEDTREIADTIEIESSSQAGQVPTEEDGVNVDVELEQQVLAQPESQCQEDDSILNSVGGASQTDQVESGSGDKQVEDGRVSQLGNTAGVDNQLGLDSNHTNTPSQTEEEQSCDRQGGFIISPGDTVGGAVHPDPSPPISRSEPQASLSEEPIPVENAQLPFYPEHHDYSNTPPRQTAIQQIPQEHTDTGDQHVASLDHLDRRVATTKADKPTVQVHAESALPESQTSESQRVESPEAEPTSSCQGQRQHLPKLCLGPEHIRGSSLPASLEQDIEEQADSVAQSIEVPEIATEESIRQLDFVPNSSIVHSTALSTEVREQNAQILPIDTDLSTQGDTTGSTRPTVEEEDVVVPASSRSRHDSSQETPERKLKSVAHSSSPIAPPPSHSLGTLDSQIPPRPATPAQPSSRSSMAARDIGDEVEQELKERLARRQAENPFTPTRRIIRSSFTPSASAPMPAPAPAPAPTQSPTLAPAPEAPAPQHISARLLRKNASPEGTRSPSTVPDRSPAPQVPTSLRTVAFAPNSNEQFTPLYDSDMTDSTGAQPQPHNNGTSLAAEISVLPIDVPEVTEPEDEELSDADDDGDSNESLLNDDLNLAREEYIVPLFIEGRQKNMYSERIQHKKDALDSFLEDPRSFNPLSEVEEILLYLRAVETHVDLVYAEAESTSRLENTSSTQVAFAAQFGTENSTKFRFLHTLFHHLREHKKHIVLVTEKDHDPLFNILETFCKAKRVNYSMPTKGRRSNPADVEGPLLVTIFPSETSPVIQAPDVIICLDGVQDAIQIRQKNWARSSQQDVVPVLHLVTPRTVGHIERYVPSAFDIRERIHTILASLAQIQTEIGRAIDEDTPRAVPAARLVGDWLITDNDDEGLSWPLPSIGSVKDIIEFQSQMSQSSTTPPAPERTKRPLDDEELDPAKRMRFTPQPQALSSSSMTNNENEITRISDSMPGTAIEHPNVRGQVSQVEEELQQERTRRKGDEQRFYEQEKIWDERQSAFEDLTQEHRLSLCEMKALREKFETVSKNNETLRERLANSTTEKRELSEQLKEQRETHLLADDAKINEITRLRTELAAAQEAKQKAIKTAQSAESTLEYTKEQYRKAQEVAASEQAANAQLRAENAKLQITASGEPVRLKALHISKQTEMVDRQNKSLRAENNILKRTLGQVQDEFARWKNNTTGRMGVGTRAQSVTPQPKTRSRAASPMGGRLSNLRNG